MEITSTSPKQTHCPTYIKAAYKWQSHHCIFVQKYINIQQTFSKRLLGRFKMAEKIKPNVRQKLSVMNVLDEKGKYNVLCEVQALF